MTLGAIVDTSTLTSTFDDEFNTFSASSDGSSGLWQTSLGGNNRTLSGNGEQEYYSDSSVGTNPFSDQNGVLNITAAPGTNALGLPYVSGAINTKNSFSQLYGYFEIDAKLPAGQGLWPAFWLLPASGAWPPELDIFEVLGSNPNTLYFSTHSSVQATQGTTLNVANVSSGFNLYGVMWGPQTVDLYINNVEVASMPTPADMNVPMYMTANLAVGGYWPGSPNSSTPFPATMQINYVRAFAYPGTNGAAPVDNPSNGGGSASSPQVPPVPASAPPAASGNGPVVTTQGTANVASGATGSLSGIGVTDSAGGNLTVAVSDSNGLLNIGQTNGVTTQGEGSTSLTLTGSTAAIDSALASLTYTANSGPTTDWLWTSATDASGLQSIGSVAVTVGPASAQNPPPSSTASSNGPIVTTQGTANVASGATGSLSGIGVTDSAGGNLTVVVSDSNGLLNTGQTNGVATQGEGSTSLTLTGSAATIDSALSSLTYTANSGSTTDWLWVSATDASGAESINSVVVSTSASATATPATTPSPSPAAAAPPAAVPTASDQVVAAPAALNVATGATESLSGVSVADSQTGGNLTVIVSDSTGLLNANAASGVTEQGAGSTALTLVGTPSAIDTTLATLTYTAGSGNGTDWLWVSANPSDATTGPQAITPVVVSVGASPNAANPGNTVNLSGVMLGVPNSAGFITATLSDSSGILATTSGQGVTATGENSAHLVLQGMAAAVNAELASLTYSGSAVNPASGTADTLNLAVMGSSGAQLNTLSLPLFSGHVAA